MILKTSYKMKPPPSARLIKGHPLTKNMVACWLANERGGLKAFDLGGTQRNDGVLQDDTHFAAGKYGTGLSFDGSGDSIVCGTGAEIHDLGPLTISVVFKSVDMGGGNMGRIIYTAESGVGPRILYWGWNPDKQFKFQVDYDVTDLYRHSDAVFSHGVWHHLVVTWDGTAEWAGIHFYKNCSDVSSSTYSNGAGNLVSDSGQSFYIGNVEADGNRGFNGIIDHMMIYDRVVTQAEITRLTVNPFCMFERSQRALVGVPV